MGVVTVRPTSTIQNGSSTLTGAASREAALSDSTNPTGTSGDSSYVTLSAGKSTRANGFIVACGTPSIPSGAKIVGVAVRMRAASVSNCAVMVQPSTKDPVTNTYAQTPGITGTRSVTAITLYQGGYDAKDGQGKEWTVASVTGLQLLITPYTAYAGAPKVYDIWVDILYNEIPVVTIVNPGATVTSATPSIDLTFSDPEGDAVEAYWVKIFTAAQHSAGGFDPTTSPAFYDSGYVVNGSAAFSLQVPDAYGLQNGQTYYVYARARQRWAGAGFFESAWASVATAVAFTPPNTPNLGAAADGTNARGVLTVSQGSGSATPTDGFDIQTSDDGGVTWTPLRTGTGIVNSVPGSNQTAYDYEMIPKTNRLYRAQAYHDTGTGVRLRSAWTASIGPIQITLTRWRLHCPSDPTKNIQIRRDGEGIDFSSEEAGTANFALGRKYAIIIASTIRGREMPLHLSFPNQAEFDAFVAIRATQEVLWLMSNENWGMYVRLFGKLADHHDMTSDNALPYWHEVQVTAIEQDRP